MSFLVSLNTWNKTSATDMKLHITDTQKYYNADFFKELRDGAHQSAEVIVPLILSWVKPSSVVDVGCGDGTWLSVFQSSGVKDILGLDGSYVLSDMLQISEEYFLPKDLSQPVSIERTFDLAMSLEVAEHLPAESAPVFVDSLTRLSEVVLFSAAIPHQGGTNHINEQWPSYWAALFATRGYVAIDILRGEIWNNPAVQPWYAQNSFLFVKSDRLSNYPVLEAAASQTSFLGQSVVHPTIYLQHCPDNSPALQEKSSESEDSRTIQILGVTLHPSTEIQTGEALTAQITYQMQSPVESAIFTLSLSNEDGTVLLDTETIVAPLSDELLISRSLQVQIDRLDLVAGNYFVNPGIFSTDGAQTYDFQQNLYPLTVRATDPGKGFLSPPMRWVSSSEGANDRKSGSEE